MKFIDRYQSELSTQIQSHIKDRKIIYLDMKFWILIRDQQNLLEDSPTAKLARKFISLYEEGKCIYPASEAVFWEILKQSDKNSLIKTFELVERLSEGIAIIGDRERVRVEFSLWLRSITEKIDQIKPNDRIWSKLPLVSGYFYYAVKAEELTEELARLLLGSAAAVPLSDLLKTSPDAFAPFTGRDDVEMMNANKEIFKAENKSRNEMFLSELGGFIDCFTQELNEVVKDMFFLRSGRTPTNEEKRNVDIRAWQKVIYHGFKSGNITDQLPMFKISPALSGSMRWNKERKYTDGNDTLDIMHATAAIPYSDYFFTENELHTIIVQEKLDHLFNCVVESKTNRILDILNQI